jgi:hypothetical protein
MREKGIIFHATEEARKNYVKKDRKDKKTYCPQCEIELRNKKIKETK